MDDRSRHRQRGPLSGFRVLELGNLIAARYAGRLFAEFGAEVIKVERPRTGDELRQWRLFRGNTSLFWSLQARNKKSITLDLRTPEGQEIVLKLLPLVDVVLENFRPGTLEKWNLGFLDGIISDWTSRHMLDEVMEAMNEAGVPAGPIYDASDIVNDPHFGARAMIEKHKVSIVPGEYDTVRFPGIVPKLSETPGETRWLGPELGAHNEEVYGQLLGFTPERLEQLKQSAII